jgi:hypothetical protein
MRKRLAGGYGMSMATAKPKRVPESKPAEPNSSSATPLKSGLPGNEQSRRVQRERFAAEHRETLRRLGK